MYARTSAGDSRPPEWPSSARAQLLVSLSRRILYRIFVGIGCYGFHSHYGVRNRYGVRRVDLRGAVVETNSQNLRSRGILEIPADPA